MKLDHLHALFITAWLVFALRPAYAQTRNELLLDEQFHTYQQGSDGSPTWHPVKGQWQIVDGGYVQQSDEYDCASLFGTYFNESFQIEAEFEYLDGDLGAGFVFSSRDRDNTAFSHMARFDGGTTFILGYFQNGEFTGVSSARSVPVARRTRHTLALSVNRESETYAVSLDGTSLGSDQPLLYPSGYIGLESSAGAVRFHSVRISRVAMKTFPRTLNWIEHFAKTPSGEFLIPDGHRGRINIVDRQGAVVRTIGAASSERGQLVEPVAVALLHDSLVVIDRGNDRLHLFLLDGTWKNSLGWKGAGRGQFDEPVAVAVNPQHQIFVVDKNNNRVQVFDHRLQFLAEFGSDKLKAPRDVALDGANIFVVNTGFSQIEWYTWNGVNATWRSSLSYGGGEGRSVAAAGDRIFLGVVNEVREYDTSGALHHTLKGRCIDFILPQGIVIENSDVYIADWFGGRIIQTDTALLDPTPSVRLTAANAAVIEWPSVERAPGTVVLHSGGHDANVQTERTSARQHSVTAGDSFSGEIMHVTFTPTLTCVPPRMRPSRTYPVAFTSTPKAAFYSRLPVAAIIFTNVRDDKTAPPAVAPPFQLPASDIQRLRRQLDDAVRFYWIHSGMRLFLDLTVLEVNEPLKRSQLYGEEWWYPPRDSMLEHFLAVNGKSIKEYSAIFYLTCTRAYDSANGTYALSGKGGAFTNGVGTGKGYGISWWDVTKANHNAGNNWLMVHEFNHQLDDIFTASGYPEYWFNHISPTIGTAARFGEHFDANRFIIRMVPKDEWLDLRYTTVETARDNDEDGIPDSAPSLPLDEVRLGSDSTKKDTDADGVPDFDELAFSNWITEGWGETAGSQVRLPDLTSEDTDLDGVPDNIDPLPCDPVQPQITFGVPTRLGEVHHTACNGFIRSWWDADSLYFVFDVDRTLPVKLMLDAQADGWFLGRDNFLITLTPGGDSLIVRTQVFNATDPARWPYMDDALANELHISASMRHRDTAMTLRVALRRSPVLGLNLKEHAVIGALVGFLCPFDLVGSKRYVDLFEPNRFFGISLIK